MTCPFPRRLLALLLAVCACSLVWAQRGVHVVEAGETLYSLSQAHGVSVEQLRALNPRMGETLYAGQEIVVPGVARRGECKLMHEVQQKETVYNLARRFGVTEEELRAANPQVRKNKVKKGEWLCIPYSQREREAQLLEQEAQRRESEAEAEAERRRHFSVAVVLPFDLGAKERSDEALKMLDFYEGFLLAVDELRGKGLSVDVYAYDEGSAGSSAMRRVMEQPMLAHADLVIGPLRGEDVASLADFAQGRGIPLVVPFSTSASLTGGRPWVFQVNTPPSALHGRVHSLLLPRLREGNVVFVEADDSKRQIAFVDGLQARLSQEGIAFRTAHLGDMVEPERFVASLEEGRENILIPTSNAQGAFESMVRRLGAAEYAAYEFRLVGYPEWQTFSASNRRAMGKYNATFFATFLTDASSPGVRAFQGAFERWFHRQQFPSYPLYGLHGYDVGRFFLTALGEQGRGFADHPGEVSVPSLQLPMEFVRRGEGDGFVNQAVRLVEAQSIVF